MFILTVPDKGVGRCLGPEVNGVSSGEGGEEGPSPPDKKQDIAVNSQQGRRQYGAGGRRKEESGVMKRTQRAQSEHSQRTFINVFKFYYIVNDVKINVVFVQENKSYGVKTICIHPLI